MDAKKAAIYVDVVNQFYAAGNVRIDYAKYLAKASEGYTVSRAFAYGAQMSEEAEGFLTVLRGLGYETRYRQAVVVGDRRDIFRTGRNMMLAMDVWRLIGRVDAVVIGSNDAELVPLVDRVREMGVQAVLYSVAVPRELREAADRWSEVDRAIIGKDENA